MLAATSRILLRFSIRRSAWALALLFLLASAPAAVRAQTAVDPTGLDSDGLTTVTAFQITELGNLVWMQQQAAANQTTGKYYALMNDIAATVTATWNDAATTTATLEGFRPIGAYSGYAMPDIASFRGIFDGNGHKVRGLTINRHATDYVGLFGYIGTSGAVRSLGVEGGTVTGHTCVGALAGEVYSGAVAGCATTAAVSGDSSVGGLIGYHNYYSAATGCFACGPVTGSSAVGGLIGYCDFISSVSLCYATGMVTGSQTAGGLAGIESGSTIRNCYATGSVRGSIYLGGLVGECAWGTIANCYAIGDVTGGLSGPGSYVGGLVGIGTSQSPTACYWDIQSSGQADITGTVGRTTAQMKRQATFAGWDFSTVWGIAENQSYPYLLASPPPYRLVVAVDGNGSVEVSPDGSPYAVGTLVTLTATPTSGTVFVGWTGLVDDRPSPTAHITLDAPKSVLARFEPAHGIRTLGELQAVATGDLSANYILMNDIDASETASWNDDGTGTAALEGFHPIGSYDVPFRGVFEGNGHRITGLVINRPTTDGIGLFGYTSTETVIRSLGLESGSASGQWSVGMLVGSNLGAVEDCYATGEVTGSAYYVGGLVGSNSGIVARAVASGNVTGDGRVGGLIGDSSQGTVRDCHATGSVTGSDGAGGLIADCFKVTITNSYATGEVTGSFDNVGGLVGNSTNDVIANCYATGAVTGFTSDVGGLIGYSYGDSITGCHATGAVTAWENTAGGLIGCNNGSVTNCYATGPVTSYLYEAGGLAGRNYVSATIANCFATGSVSGLDYVGGLSGYGGSTSAIANCYSVGPVAGSGSYVGGLAGSGSAGTVTGSYWDTQCSGQQTSAGGTGRSTAQMKQQATFGGWNFSTLWSIVEHDSYPYFFFAPPPFALIATVQGHGTVDISPAGGTYAPGTVVTLTATPAAGSELVGWTGAVADSGALVTTVTMDCHKNVAASFVSRYEIRTLSDLQAAATEELNGHFLLMDNIDASDTANWNDAATSTDTREGFLPIGSSAASFQGTFDGNGHTITGLTIRRPAANSVGLFGAIGRWGVVTDLTLEACAVAGHDSVGGLAGYAKWGAIANCAVTGAVAGNSAVGGLAGSIDTTSLESCRAGATVTGLASQVGGLLGSGAYATVSTSFATGAVTGSTCVGGLIGRSYFDFITICYAAGAASGSTEVGGLIGESGSSVIATFATGPVTGSSYVGGLVGYNLMSTIAASYSVGAVGGSGSYIGGLAGMNGSSIDFCYWNKESSGRTGSSGGIGLTSSQMKQQASFVPAGSLLGYWNFTSVWASQGGYPYLRAFATHTLTYAAGAHGSVDGSPSESQSVNHGASGAPVTAIPDSISHFVRWSDGATANPRTDLNVTADLSITATFMVNLYHLAYALTGSGSLDGATSQTVVQGTSGTPVRAIPDAGSYFMGWSDGSTANPRTDTNVSGNLSVTARFVAYTPVRTIADLQAIATGDLTACYVLMNDIDASDTAKWNDAATTTATLEGFRPIGTNSSRFVGLFDGGGHKITGLTMMRTTTDYVGLFGFVGAGGVVRNVRLEGGTVYGRSYVGALAGSCDTAAITSCGITTNVRGYSSYVGGMVGASRATSLTNCFDTGSVTGFSSYVGGLVGYNTTTPGALTNCFASGAVTGFSYAGGLVGYNFNSGPVTNCYATGTVWGSSTAGGLVGYHFGGTLATCYASGAVTCSSSPGGLIGSRPSGTVTACYWDTQTTKQSASAGGTGKTTAEMRQQGTFLPAGTATGQWDFPSVWGIQNLYPYLRSLPAYTLTYLAAANGLIDGATSESQTVNYGARGASVAAVPATNYHFVQWSDGSKANPRTDINVVANRSVTATFAINQYHLSYAPGPGGSLSGVTSQTLNYLGNGTQVTALPSTDYHFVRWSDGVATTARTDLAVAGDITVTAVFAFNAYTLTYTAGSGGSLTGATSQTVAYSQSGMVVLAVADPGWYFDRWSDGSAANPRTDTNVCASIAVTAQFLPAIQVHTLAELQAIATGDLTAHYALMDDIDASVTATWNDVATTTATLEGFRPIGTYTVAGVTSFRGIFEGNGHRISGLSISRPGSDYVGLFGAVGSLGVVRNLGLEGGSVIGRDNVGGLVGLCYTDNGVPFPSFLANCYATAAVTGRGDVGGLVGNNWGSITDCFAAGPVVGHSELGGLAGSHSIGSMTNCYATGAVGGSGSYLVGGLVGFDAYGGGTVTNCFATGKVVGLSGSTLGGLAGQFSGTIAASYWDTESSGQAVSGGGTGETTAEMKQQGTFLPAGTGAGQWDLTSVWGIQGGYPYLRAFPVHTVTYMADANGSVDGAPSESQIVNRWGRTAPVLAVPVTGYHFAHWSDGSTANPRQDAGVVADASVTATFSDACELIYTAGTGGSLVGATSATLAMGGNGTQVTAVPAAHYHFVKWSDGVLTASRTDLGVTGDVIVTAIFELDAYTVTYLAAAHGSISGVTPQTVGYGTDATTVTATANPGYHFVQWSDGVLTTARTDLGVAGDITVTATFAANTYTLTYAAAAHGSISGLTPQTVAYGDNASTVTANANPGYHFVQWSDGVMTATRTDLDVTGDVIVTALFGIDVHSLAYAACPGGSLTGVTSQTLTYGSNGTEVTAVPSTGYHFVSWSDGALTAARTDLNVTGDIAVTAFFAINRYTLTYTAGSGGSISGATSQTLNHGGDGTQVTAVPAAGYHFVQWSDGVLTAARTDRGVTGDIGVTVSFAINRYSLAYTAGPGGSIVGVTSQTLNHGSNGTPVTAVPATGYHFVQWSDNVMTAARTDLGVTGDITVTASFAINRYSLAYTAGPGGSIVGATSQTLNHGGDGTQVTALPAPGYHFVQWSDGVMTAARTDRGVTGDISVTASFAIDLHAILAVAPANQNVAAAAGSASLSVTNAGTGAMDWTAQTIGGADWLTIASGASGSDAGTVVVSFAANTGAARTGTITLTATSASGAVVNSPSSVTITQAAGDSPAAGAFLARRVKSSHSEQWDGKGARIVAKDAYSFSAKMQLPVESLASLNNATTLTLVLGDAVTSGAACEVFERPLSAATKSTLAGHPTAKKPKDSTRGGSVTFVELQPNSKKKARVVTIKWTKTGVLTATVVGAPALANWDPSDPAQRREVENIADLCDGAEWPEGVATGVAVPTLVDLSGVFIGADTVACGGKKSVKPSDGGDLVGWSVSGK